MGKPRPTRNQRRRVSKLRRDAAARDGWRCLWCGQPVSDLIGRAPRPRATLEHVVPLSQGGAHTLANAAIACSRCNHLRGSDLFPPQRLIDSIPKRERVAMLERFRVALDRAMDTPGAILLMPDPRDLTPTSGPPPGEPEGGDHGSDSPRFS